MLMSEAFQLTERSASVIGTVRFHKSDSDDCVCCEGKHIYGASIEIPQGRLRLRYPGLYYERIEEFIHDALFDLPDLEGKRVRVTIESIE